uniref:F-box only protein 40-like n=1 Tax=Monopterus albus TaxID=43700 RepID=UPI0009B457D6|nr:F-box only protein 40-like [Monopterus albus]
MSHRSRASRVQQHVHCDSCYSRRCRARVEPSMSCALIPCRLHCGAVFHLCKEEDHLLLCPNVRVPCFNAEYGCPVQLARSLQAAHLQVCPASVVCCSMEWNRWPTDDTNPQCNTALQENVLKERIVSGAADCNAKKENDLCENDVVKLPTQSSVVQDSVPSKDKYNLSEIMFSMEKGGCAVAQAGQDNPEQNPRPGEKGIAQSGRDLKEAERQDGAAVSRNCPLPDTKKTGLAPWQEGVLERLGQELTPQEYNMYMVHHGRMLLAFGQIEACTPREKDFVYGSLEPIPVQTLHPTYKTPVSYHYGRRINLYNTAVRAQSETRSVDTSDLRASEEDWFSDEAAATLLGYAEKEVMGHKISESKTFDGIYVDVGTQTHSFRSSPFKKTTTLEQVMVDKPLKLHLQLQTESVNSRHNRASSVFTFLCGHTFHRREFATHYRNVHSDIQMCLSGWFEQRCPLSYLGCTYSQRRFQPSTHKATVTYNQQLRSFNLRPTLVTSVDESSQAPRGSVGSSFDQRKRGGQAGGGEDSLSSLPYEVLCHMASFLDSLSLSQLALVSRLMRQVCSSLLQERGMVTLCWEKKTYSRGGTKWRAKPVWEFSHLFSPVDLWHMVDTPPISAHLKVCSYYKTFLHIEPVPLPSMSEKQGRSQENWSLINHFTGNRWQQ